MRGRISHQELHSDLRIEGGVVAEIVAGMERQSIDPGFECCAASEQLRNPAIAIGDAFARSHEVSVRRQAFGSYADSLRRLAFGRIENVGADSVHAVISFCSRSKVILFCSSAATRISCSAEFDRRDRRIANISSAFFPLAHTMKM